MNSTQDATYDTEISEPDYMDMRHMDSKEFLEKLPFVIAKSNAAGSNIIWIAITGIGERSKTLNFS